MFKIRIVKTIVVAYFLTALAFSFTHFIDAAHKVGLSGIGAGSMPFAVDGLALVGMLLRSKYFDDTTNRIGLRMQLICGTLSLAVNIYAGNTIGESVQGATWVCLYIMLESLTSKIRTRKATEDAQAIADAEATVQAASAWMTACNHPTACTTAEQCERKSTATAKARKTVARKTRQSAAQAKALDALVNG